MSEFENGAPALPRPTSYDELYPGRFLKAVELGSKKPLLTIADIYHEKLQGNTGKLELKVIISFRETQKMLVACKTNGMCLKAMFGKTLADWMGKRVNLFPTTWNGDDCIRVWGSPDIEREFEVDIALPRKKPFKMVMHKTVKGSAAPQSSQREPGTEG